MAGLVHENGETLKLSLYGTTVCPVPQASAGSYVSVTSQARLHGVLGRMSMYETFLVTDIQERVYIQYLIVLHPPPPPPNRLADEFCRMFQTHIKLVPLGKHKTRVVSFAGHWLQQKTS
jgi:hypothetical protein